MYRRSHRSHTMELGCIAGVDLSDLGAGREGWLVDSSNLLVSLDTHQQILSLLLEKLVKPDSLNRHKQCLVVYGVFQTPLMLAAMYGKISYAKKLIEADANESADNVSTESTSPSKDALLEEACRKYEEATQFCPTLNDAFYNWAIAISDRAKLRGRTKEAEELWKQATKNYEKAVQLNWNSPQALNNWGLALQVYQ